MDLSKLKTAKADEGATLELLHPSTMDVIEGMTITLLGQDSQVYRKLSLGKQQAALNRMKRGKKAEDLDAEKLSEDSINDLVKLTVAWTGFERDGKPVEFNEVNVKNIYTEFPWIREQAQEFIADRANFFR